MSSDVNHGKPTIRPASIAAMRSEGDGEKHDARTKASRSLEVASGNGSIDVADGVAGN